MIPSEETLRRLAFETAKSWIAPEKDDWGLSRLRQPYIARRPPSFLSTKRSFVAGPATVRLGYGPPSDVDKECDALRVSSVVVRIKDIKRDPIEDAIRRSHELLALADNWDGEGALGYSENTLNRTADYVRRLSALSEQFFGRPIAVPQIAPADNGSIDLFWDGDAGTLLINIPANVNQPATYFGENRGNKTSGIIKDIEERLDLVAWITTRR